jgi:hypothetical protein
VSVDGRNPNPPKPRPPPFTSDEIESPLTFATEAAPVRPSEPVVMLHVSRDGGATWSAAVSRPLGGIGEYDQITRWFRQGSGRNIVLRFSISDPVPVTVLDVLVKAS